MHDKGCHLNCRPVSGADEVRGEHSCEFCSPLLTQSGRVLTGAELDALAAEAERGYDVTASMIRASVPSQFYWEER